MPARPIPVTILSWLLILAGAVGLVYHLRELDVSHPFAGDILLVELVRLLAIVAGVFMLRGRNWARWLALLWIAFHVVVSYWHSWPEVAIHVAIFAVFAFLLFRSPADQYFRRSASTR
jgi:hypothetical protein